MMSLYSSNQFYDFCDGLGLVLAHRHVNGGGWVADTAHVADTAYVGPRARVHGYAVIKDSAVIDEEADVSGYCHIKDYACVRGNAVIRGTCEIADHAIISGNIFLAGHARIGGHRILDEQRLIFAGMDCLLCPALLDENYTSGHDNPCLDCLDKYSRALKRRKKRSRDIAIWATLEKKRPKEQEIGEET